MATRAVADALDAPHVVRRLGAVPLKGIAEPVELVELALCPQPHERSVDPVCGMAVATRAVAATVRSDGGVVVFCSTDCAGRYLQARAR